VCAQGFPEALSISGIPFVAVSEPPDDPESTSGLCGPNH